MNISPALVDAACLDGCVKSRVSLQPVDRIAVAADQSRVFWERT